MTLTVVPISLRDANAFVDLHHRHHGSARGHKFSIAVSDDSDTVVGVAIVGRPVARGLDTGRNVEVLRLCTLGARNACSMLYGACARAARAMGFEKIYTYTLESEDGASLRASGWKREELTAGGSWSCTSRPRDDKHPTCPKWRWSLNLKSSEAVVEQVFPVATFLQLRLAVIG